MTINRKANKARSHEGTPQERARETRKWLEKSGLPSDKITHDPATQNKINADRKRYEEHLLENSERVRNRQLGATLRGGRG